MSRLTETFRGLKRFFDAHRVIALSAAYTGGVLGFLVIIATTLGGGGSATARAEARSKASTVREAPRARARTATATRAGRRRDDSADARIGRREYEVDVRGPGAPPAPEPGGDGAASPEAFGAEPLPADENQESFDALPPAAGEDFLEGEVIEDPDGFRMSR